MNGKGGFWTGALAALAGIVGMLGYDSWAKKRDRLQGFADGYLNVVSPANASDSYYVAYSAGKDTRATEIATKVLATLPAGVVIDPAKRRFA